MVRFGHSSDAALLAARCAGISEVAGEAHRVFFFAREKKCAAKNSYFSEAQARRRGRRRPEAQPARNCLRRRRNLRGPRVHFRVVRIPFFSRLCVRLLQSDSCWRSSSPRRRQAGSGRLRPLRALAALPGQPWRLGFQGWLRLVGERLPRLVIPDDQIWSSRMTKFCRS